MKKIEQKMAFWKYDLFPYMLGGTVISRSLKDHTAKIKEYGHSYYVWFFLPLRQGREFLRKLTVLRKERDEQLKQVEEQFRKRLMFLREQYQPYPDLVCQSCGRAASKGKQFQVSTWYNGTCGACGEPNVQVTEARDFYYPPFEGHKKP